MTEHAFTVSSMSCPACERTIERNLLKIPGVLRVTARYAAGTVAVQWDETQTSPEAIAEKLTALNYPVVHTKPKTARQALMAGGVAVLLVGLFLLLRQLGVLDLFNVFPQAEAGMTLAAVFVVGLFTSVHCVGMCGGINLSQNLGNDDKRLRPSFLYNMGRVLSYTAIGGIVGAIGALVAPSGVFRGAVALLAGLFMVLMGLNLLGAFPFLKRITPHLPRFFTKAQGKSTRPLVVGLLNGLMPCGPLQAMQLFALSTGDPVRGALSMFFFAMGTVPLMFSLGALSAFLSKTFQNRMRIVSAVLVVLLGAGMLNTGISMSGFMALGTEQAKVDTGYQPVMEDGFQLFHVEVGRRSYEPMTLKVGVPARVNFHVADGNLNGCNNAIMIPGYVDNFPLKVGDNFLEWTPDRLGTQPYSCWMNMIRSSVTVLE